MVVALLAVSVPLALMKREEEMLGVGELKEVRVVLVVVVPTSLSLAVPMRLVLLGTRLSLMVPYYHPVLASIRHGK